MRSTVFDPDVSRRFGGHPLADGRGGNAGYTPPPVIVSYFDPRTGEPCDCKPEPLHGAAKAGGRMGKKAKYDEARKRAGQASKVQAAKRKAAMAMHPRKRPKGAGAPPKAVLVDGMRYASVRLAAESVGGTQAGLSTALSRGAARYRGHEVAWA